MRREPETRIVHRDDHLLVLDKPPGIPTTSPDRTRCLVDLARELDPKAPNLHPTSRLDAEVSGLVTFARTKRANEALMKARAAGRYRRLYLALAPAAPSPPEGEWRAAIAIDPRDKRKRTAVGEGVVQPGSREAWTEYETGAVRDAGCVLWLWPRTGRTHQLRVHAAAAGIPLLGDVPYGGARRLVRPDGRVIHVPRVMLHCHALRLPRIAGDGGELVLGSPARDDIMKVWAGIGGVPSELRHENVSKEDPERISG